MGKSGFTFSSLDERLHQILRQMPEISKAQITSLLVTAGGYHIQHRHADDIAAPEF